MSDREGIVRYLLGEASEEERSRFEERLFGDEEFFDRVLEVETDLMDDYAAGAMNLAERERMERTLLRTVSGSQRLAVSKALGNILANRPQQPPTGAKRYWIAAAVLIVLAGGALVDDVRLRLRSSASVEHRQEPAPEAAQANTATPAGQALFSVLLLPGAKRGSGEVRKFSIPIGARAVELQLDFDSADGRLFQASLSTARGNQLVQVSGLTPRRTDGAHYLPLSIPAELLSPSRYELALSTPQGKPVNFYYFEVAAP